MTTETAAKAGLIPQPHGGALSGRWQPGQSGNPGGSRTAGAWYRERLNQMRGWNEQQLREVADNVDSPAVDRQAARTHLRAMADGWHNATPLAGNDIDRICDRTEGKPTQHVHVTKQDIDVEGAVRGMADLLRQFPEMKQWMSVPEIVADAPALPVE